MPFTITTELSSQQIADLFTTAIEGGSNYWCSEVRLKPEIQAEIEVKFPNTCWYACSEVYDRQDLEITIIPIENDPPATITPLSLQRGLNTMAKLNPLVLARISDDNYDAGNADIFLQFISFNELVYG